jgi:uncharacterized protein (TIGR02118 family)
MIKVVELIVRKPGMTREQFHDHWYNVHGPLVMSIPEIRRHNVKYVQSHTLSDWFPFLAGSEPVYDGAAEIWLDSIDAVHEMFAEPKFQELVYPDELLFLDHARTQILVLTEHLVYHRPGAAIHGGLKLFEIPVRPASMTRQQCQAYWHDVHGPMVLDTPAMVTSMRRYSQSHTLTEDIPAIGPMKYDGLAELWFDTADDLERCFGPEYLATVHEDEHSFVDLEQSTAFVAKEFVMYERPLA